uniref:Uncharacterized protein n=1 Tax=Anguilla anguilla TaxID=7936 RepID=A0A0E9T187_ANGAN
MLCCLSAYLSAYYNSYAVSGCQPGSILLMFPLIKR